MSHGRKPARRKPASLSLAESNGCKEIAAAAVHACMSARELAQAVGMLPHQINHILQGRVAPTANEKLMLLDAIDVYFRKHGGKP